MFVCDDSVRVLWTRNGPPVSLAGPGGPFLGARRHPVLMVGTDEDEVDRVLRAGGLACPGCSGVLAPWGYARRRKVRAEGEVWRLRPRRSRCSAAGGCGRTHVLLPTSCLVRRADSVAVIGAALVDRAAGLGHRRIAEVKRPF